MSKKAKRILSVFLSVIIVFGGVPVINVGADTALEIFDSDKVHITEKQYLTEYRSAQLYAMVPVTAEDGTVTGTEVDTSQGGYVTWESNLPLLANVDSAGKVTAYDYSKRAVIELWINENIRVIPLTGDALADSIWNALESTGTDLDDMDTDAIVTIVTALAGETLGESLRKALDNMNVEITATYYDAEGNIVGSDKVEFVIEKSLVANVAPTGVHITNKSTVPTTVAVGATVQLRGFCTPTRLNQGVKFSMGSSILDSDSKNFATVTEDGLVTFTAPGTATVRVNPESTLYGTFSDTITFTILDPADLPVEDFEIIGSASVGEGETIQLSVDNVSPAGAYYGDLTWSTADPTIAVVDANGVVTGLDGGSGITYSREVVITATVGDLSKDITIKVTRPIINTIASVEISGDDSLAIGTTGEYIATVKPDRINTSSGVTREWGVIHPVNSEKLIATADAPATDGVVSVDVNGNVTALSSGVAQIYCRATLNKDSVEDTKAVVCGNAITDFEITGTNALKEGEKTTLNINVLAPADYETALLDTVVWSVSDEGIASISESGLVLARDAGGKRESKTVTITATVSGISRTFSITVSGNGIFSTDKLTDGSVEGLENVIVDLPRRFEMKTYPARIEGKATYWGVSTDDGGEPWNVSDNYNGADRVTENSFASVSEITENDIVYGIISGKVAGDTAIHAYRKNSSLIGTGKSYVEAHKDIKIIEVEPTSITLKTPDKTEYLEGDTELDLTGLEVYLNYDKNVIGEYYPDADTYTTEMLTAQVTDYTVGTFDPEVLDTTQYVIVSVTRAGKTYNAVIPIVVKSKIVKELHITEPNKKAYVEGDTELDTIGLKATVDYENFDSETVTPQVDYSSFSFAILNEEQQVRVFYEHAGRTVEAFYPITVFKKPVVSVDVNGTIGEWTTENIEFNLSCENVLTSVSYYWKYADKDTFVKVSGSKYTLKNSVENGYQFRAEISGYVYGKNITVTGDWSDVYEVKLDNLQPRFELVPEVEEFTNKNYRVNVEDLVYGVSGIDYIKHNDSIVSDSFSGFNVTGNGTHTVEIKTKVGLVTTKTIEINNIDKIAPVIADVAVTQVPEGSPENHFDGKFGDYYSGDVKATVTATDEGVSGIKGVYYRLVESDYTPVTEWATVPDSGEVYCSEQFTGYFEFKVEDNAGNESPSTYSNGFVRDNEKPIITELNAVCGGEEYIADTWADDIVELTPKASAYSGIYEYYYNIDGGEWIKLTKETLLVKDDGVFTYSFKAVSYSGLESDASTCIVKIDRTVPVVRVSADGTIGRWTNEDVTFNLSTVNECPSGKTFYFNDGTGWQELDGTTLVVNYSSNAVYSFKAINGAGLQSVTSDEYRVMVDKVKPTAQVIFGVTEKTDSPYDLAIIPQVGEAGYLQIYFNGEDITEALKYTVTKNGTYALTIIGNNLLSSTVMVEVNNFSSLPTMNFTYSDLGNGKLTITSYNGSSANITVPLSIDNLITAEISDGAFSGNAKIESVNIPNTVTKIGNSFENCESLKEVVISPSVTEISENAFAGCENFTIYCYSGSYAQKYAQENNIPYLLLDLCPVGKTSVNNKTGCIFTQEMCKTDISAIASVGEGCNIFAVPSYVGGNTNYYGTGSIVYCFKNGTMVGTYTVIVCGDLNGDSVVDVFDASIAKRAQRKPDTLKDHYLLAADFDNNGVVENSDYNQICWLLISG